MQQRPVYIYIIQHWEQTKKNLFSTERVNVDVYFSELCAQLMVKQWRLIVTVKSQQQQQNVCHHLKSLTFLCQVACILQRFLCI